MSSSSNSDPSSSPDNTDFIPLKDNPKDTSSYINKKNPFVNDSFDSHDDSYLDNVNPFEYNVADDEDTISMTSDGVEFHNLGITETVDEQDKILSELQLAYPTVSRYSETLDKGLLNGDKTTKGDYTSLRRFRKPFLFDKLSPYFTHFFSEIYAAVLRVVGPPRANETPGRNLPFSPILRQIYNHPLYNIFIFVVIVLHAVLLMIRSDDPHDKSQTIDYLIIVIGILYTLEMLLKIYLFGFLYDGSSSFYDFINSYTKKTPRTMSYLRHSWNRVDFVAIVALWISVIGKKQQGIFRLFSMIACLRLTRLLNITRKTETILKSLKESSTPLVQVVSFNAFFGVMIAILGVQFFKASLNRQCVWLGDYGDQYLPTGQFCGGHWENGIKRAYLDKNGFPSNVNPRGFICAEKSVCRVVENPYSNTVSFDNFFNSLELIFVIMSSNGFTDIMYDIMDAEYFVSCLLFIISAYFLTLWLMSLVIAVVTSSFIDLQHSGKNQKEQKSVDKHLIRNKLCEKYLFYSNFIWISFIVAQFVTLCTQTYDQTSSTANRYLIFYACVDFLLAAEVILRFFAYLPDYRLFFRRYTNLVDIVLAVLNLVTLLPSIRKNPVAFGWLSIFAIARIYRCILLIPYTRKIAKLLFSNFKQLLNLMLFLVIVLFIASLCAVRLFQDLPNDGDSDDDAISFATTYESFLYMYQILTSENWTDVMFAIQARLAHLHLSWIPGAFFTLWFLFSNNVVLSMFIAVIQVNFAPSESDLKMEQLKMYLARLLRNYNPFQASLTLNALIKRNGSRKGKTVDESHYEWLYEDNIIKGFLRVTNIPPKEPLKPSLDTSPELSKYSLAKLSNNFKRFVMRDDPFSQAYFKRVIGIRWEKDMNLKTAAKDMQAAKAFVRIKQTEFLKNHPKYNDVFWVIKPSNRIRRFCQRLVMPGVNERYGGVEPYQWVYRVIQVFIYACILTAVIIECIATPIYERDHLLNDKQHAWFVWTEVAFATIFTIEAAIKIIADGFCITPNAYLRSTWNCIDFFVLVTLWINLYAVLTSHALLSRAFRAFKALRVLRLINLTQTSQRMFHDALISGFFKIFSAAVVSATLLIPFALWAKNVFGGLLYSCNDDNVLSASQCVLEYASTPNNWEVWAPRVWSNPPDYDFDRFPHALLALFEIASIEGWVDIMRSVMDITGFNNQPQTNASSGNAMFFVLFNLVSMIYILTLFIAIIISNYAERTGSAFFTAEQRAWLELRRKIKSMRPSKRPAIRPLGLRGLCYDFAVQKHGIWRRTFTGLYIVHLLFLLTIFYPCPIAYTYVRNSIFLILSICYTINICVKVYGLSFYYFFHSFWNMFDVVVTLGSLTCNIAILAKFENRSLTLLQTTLLVLVTVHLIPKFDNFDQLSKTVVASLPSIFSLIATWIVLYITFAIAFNQIFGLTKLGLNGGPNKNFRSIRNALVLLFTMTFGEGWNDVMHDYTISYPNCVNGDDFYNSDCGNKPWAYGLFIAWNIISMYIFVNMFITVVFDNFSYIHTKSSSFTNLQRNDFRQFKDSWAPFDPMVTGYIPKRNAVKFVLSLRGVYDFRIYRDEHTLRSIISKVQSKTGQQSVPMLENPLMGSEINLEALDQIIDTIDVNVVKERRNVLNSLCTEIMTLPGNVISFSNILMLVVLHKIVDHREAFPISDYIRRAYVLSELEKSIRMEKLLGLVETSIIRKTFLQHMEEKKKALENPFILLSEVSEILPETPIQEVLRQHNADPEQLLMSTRTPSVSDRSFSIVESTVPTIASGEGDDNHSVEDHLKVPTDNEPRRSPSLKEVLLRGSHSLHSNNDRTSFDIEAGFGTAESDFQFGGATEDINRIADRIDDYLDRDSFKG
ncbi:Calcium-channel protein cch1 [Schizosaccharomyces pombe]|uniref:Calcium-channel protein cch1 n=1 Tax=Schizosaccharomyces pombe (strain 972 / ATCC 24843) TaxID=284812 RepID=CCH1_SCHPO|nr:calcium channel Cch1 [Schizosaccharomyces pombe]O14234.1 RecName: Full=Calcium-channel protein cch1 [Schizosaccharomyces pombe 972h-]CAB11726.1 calcium channel Cch1 [Schizosaccharomyces pombe]|eukprot:NP_593894.1 calcium channel Cch1 [Schizosaccharomyces pombe]